MDNTSLGDILSINIYTFPRAQFHKSFASILAATFVQGKTIHR